MVDILAQSAGGREWSETFRPNLRSRPTEQGLRIIQSNGDIGA